MRHGVGRTPFILLFVAMYLASACAGKRAEGTTNFNPNVISGGELDTARNAGTRDLHELISRIRPRWLDVRAERSLHLQTTIAVYVNNSRLGGPDALRGFPLASISSIRYLDAAEAMRLPGAGSTHVEGAIVISTALR